MAELTLDQVKKKGIPLTVKGLLENGILTQSKIDWLYHPAPEKIVIGSKGSGKTFPVKVKTLLEAENDEMFNSATFRKYQASAAEKSSEVLHKAYMDLKNMGVEFKYEWVKKNYRMTRLKHKSNMMVNQQESYYSLEDTNATDGGAPSNGGVVALINVDEPMNEADAANPSKIPTVPEWERTTEVLRDNMERHSDSYELRTGIRVPFEIFYTLNPWGKTHPLMIKASKILPESTFVEWIFGMQLDELLGKKELIDNLFSQQWFVDQLINRNTMMAESEDGQTLVVRTTKFANPINHLEKKLKPLVNKVRYALETSNKTLLLTLMGFEFEPEISKDMLVYNIQEFNYKTPEEAIEEGFHIEQIVYPFDIDTSRILTCFPTFKMVKNVLGLDGIYQIRIILVDKPIELKAYGTGEFGEMNDIYVKQMQKQMVRHYSRISKLSKPKHKSIVRVDDKRKWFLNGLRKLRDTSFQGLYQIFDQHGAWATGERQDMVVDGIEKRVLWFHPKNNRKAGGSLVQDMKVCIRRNIDDPRRLTDGTKNYLDRIDSMEQGVIPFANLIYKTK